MKYVGLNISYSCQSADVFSFFKCPVLSSFVTYHQVCI